MAETAVQQAAATGRGKRGVVVLHDYVEQTDGGSRLCLILGRALGADFCCGFARKGHPFFAEPYPGRVRTLMPSLPVPLARQLALALAFEHRTGFIEGYGTAIFSGSYAPLAARSRDTRRDLYYCHTPPRFLYDQRDFFMGLAPLPLRPLLAAFLHWLQPRYEAAIARMGGVVANSQAVRERVRRHLGLDVPVVHPPCETSRYRSGADQGYFLSMARLDPLKRVGTVVEAFRRLPGQRLVVASDGPQAPELKRLARGAANITFVGAVDEARLVDLLAHCRATVCVSVEEDFGMAAVESMAAGKPVLAAAAGGFLETVLDGRTGVWLPSEVSPGELARAVAGLDAKTAAGMAEACREQAERYSTSEFLKGISAALHRLG